MPQLCQILKGVRISQGQKGRTIRPRLPITPRFLRLMKRVWFPSDTNSSYDNLMLWAASTIAFFGFCHSGEITTPSDNSFEPHIHLSYADVTTDNPKCPSMLSINLKHSKTDQERKGIKIIIGKTGDAISAMLNFLKVRRSCPGPLFRRKSGTPLSKSRFVDSVRSALTKANLPADVFAGHSFRIGSATTAASAGICDSSIQSLGRWKSSAYLLYTRAEPKSWQKFPQLCLCVSFNTPTRMHWWIHCSIHYYVHDQVLYVAGLLVYLLHVYL